MASTEGDYFHRATSEDENACGVYIFADPDQRIEVRFNYLDVPCENGGLVSVSFNWVLCKRLQNTHDKVIPLSSLCIKSSSLYPLMDKFCVNLRSR